MLSYIMVPNDDWTLNNYTRTIIIVVKLFKLRNVNRRRTISTVWTNCACVHISAPVFRHVKRRRRKNVFLKGMIQSLKRLNTVYATLPDAASNYNAILEIQSTTHRLNKAEGFSRIFVSIVRRYYVNGEFWSKIPTFKSVRIDSSFSSKNNPVRVTMKL